MFSLSFLSLSLPPVSLAHTPIFTGSRNANNANNHGHADHGIQMGAAADREVLHGELFADDDDDHPLRDVAVVRVLGHDRF